MPSPEVSEPEPERLVRVVTAPRTCSLCGSNKHIRSSSSCPVQAHNNDLKFLIDNGIWNNATVTVNIPSVQTYINPLTYEQMKLTEAKMGDAEFASWSEDVKARASEARKNDAAEELEIKAQEARLLAELQAKISAARVALSRKRRRVDTSSDDEVPMAAPVAEPGLGAAAAAAARAFGIHAFS